MKETEILRKKIGPMVGKGLCVAFSGGVDSSLLLKIACDLGKIQDKQVFAVTFDTELHPSADLPLAKAMAQEFGATHQIISVNEFESVDILNNPIDRCYRCKKHLFQTLLQFSQENKLLYTIDGTNFDDLSAYRPGIQALKELGVSSPLAEEKITKETVRQIAVHLGISVANRPSSPCLATRLPYNTAISMELLKKIDQGEELLQKKGFLVNRIRVHGDIARVEILPEQFTSFLELGDEVISPLKSLGFRYITLDLEGLRSGSMDIHLNTGGN